MNVWVENGLAGCALAVERGAVAVVVDALRASATLTSLFHYGTESALVVREVAEAFAERERRPGAVLVGERGGPMVPGFDLGNSPLCKPPEVDISQVIFSSSNCSRCCVGVGTAPAAFVGTTVNATALAGILVEACAMHETNDVVLITAGAAEDEVRLTMEDHLAAGAIIGTLHRLGVRAPCANDRARVCIELCNAFEPQGEYCLYEPFKHSENGNGLRHIGLAGDVEYASRLDVYSCVPRLAELVPLQSGGQGALLVRAK